MNNTNSKNELENLKKALVNIQEVKKQFDKLGLDSSQLHGPEGEALAQYVIRVIVRDKDYKPAPPRQANIDGTGALGGYSVKYWSPIVDKVKRESNKIQINSDLNFDWLFIITPTSIYNVPRKKIVKPLGGGRGRPSPELAQKAIDEGLLTYTQQRDKYAITDSNRNLEILEEHYKICENNFDFSK